MGSIFVVDTNVVVAGLLTARPDSAVARILDGMLAAAFLFAVSEALLAEYAAILHRPAVRKLHGLEAEEIEIILVTLARHAMVLSPVPAPPAPDPGDQHLWNLLAVRQDLCLVTGDKLLQGDAALASRILSPAGFVAQWPAGFSPSQ